MKPTGIVRKLDELGRIVLPKELRKTLDLEHRDPMEIYLDGDKVILKKYQPTCLFCGNAKVNIVYKEKNICKPCANEIKKK